MQTIKTMSNLAKLKHTSGLHTYDVMCVASSCNDVIYTGMQWRGVFVEQGDVVHPQHPRWTALDRTLRRDYGDQPHPQRSMQTHISQGLSMLVKLFVSSRVAIDCDFSLLNSS